MGGRGKGGGGGRRGGSATKDGNRKEGVEKGVRKGRRGGSATKRTDMGQRTAAEKSLAGHRLLQDTLQKLSLPNMSIKM